MTGVCFVGVLDAAGSKFFFVPVFVFVAVGLVGLGLGFVLLRPVRKFVKDVLMAETTELDKLAGKMGKNVLSCPNAKTWFLVFLLSSPFVAKVRFLASPLSRSAFALIPFGNFFLKFI